MLFLSFLKGVHAELFKCGPSVDCNFDSNELTMTINGTGPMDYYNIIHSLG